MVSVLQRCLSYGQYKTRTADQGLRTGYKMQTRNYGLSIKHGLGIKRGVWTVI